MQNAILTSYVQKYLRAEAENRKYRTQKQRKSTQERQREQNVISKIMSRLCTFNALLNAIYTSPHGTDRSTMYFNAHTSI